MSELVLYDTNEREPENVETRVWRPSRPVIHIAAALAVAIDIAQKNGEVLSDADLFARSDVIRWVVSTSEEYADLIPKIKRFTIKPDSLIRLVLV